MFASVCNPSRMPELIALRCGSEVPEQITKKSVKVEISLRSSTTISSAFLSSASLTQSWASSLASMLVSLV